MNSSVGRWVGHLSPISLPSSATFALLSLLSIWIRSSLSLPSQPRRSPRMFLEFQFCDSLSSAMAVVVGRSRQKTEGRKGRKRSCGRSVVQ